MDVALEVAKLIWPILVILAIGGILLISTRERKKHKLD
jgi:hypothetical protein